MATKNTNEHSLARPPAWVRAQEFDGPRLCPLCGAELYYCNRETDLLHTLRIRYHFYDCMNCIFNCAESHIDSPPSGLVTVDLSDPDNPIAIDKGIRVSRYGERLISDKMKSWYSPEEDYEDEETTP